MIIKMVIICDKPYQSDKYNNIFTEYPYKLSDFQKYAIEAIIEDQNILITAHTGSGKTLAAEFAIEHFVKMGKRVIYTSPIKALSNQKFYEFSKKYPHISFGILTGDIKTNENADVVIMTTEILQNKLFRSELFDNIACVVFDEIHYINDAERGKVWEQTIMMLPKDIQMVMLSATLDTPGKFAAWVESCNPSKQVYLASTDVRVVPLTHYSFITCNQGFYKILKDKDVEQQIRKLVNKPIVLQSAQGVFNETNYFTIQKTLKLFESKHNIVKRSHAINQVAKYLVENDMLPAICFVLSRKTLEICARELTTVLLEDDSKVRYMVRTECEQIIRKLPNYEEYLRLPEYHFMVSLLEKGVAIHHSGIMPVLREMAELLFAKGYVKMLFATETFAVGINMPTKTVIFTDVNKFDGRQMRTFFSHEYTQMAGRAGRRGIDTIGNVIHLSNLFKPELAEYKCMMKGAPQLLISKFKISYTLILKLIDIGEQDFGNFTNKSMIKQDITAEVQQINILIKKKSEELLKIRQITDAHKTPIAIIQEFLSLGVENVSNRQKKENEKKRTLLCQQYMELEREKAAIVEFNHLYKEYSALQREYEITVDYIDDKILRVVDLLEMNEFIIKKEVYILTDAGTISTFIHEVPGMVFAKVISKLNNFSATDLVVIFSCFTNITMSDEYKSLMPRSTGDIKEFMLDINDAFNYYMDTENQTGVDSGTDWHIQYDLMEYIKEWCECVDEVGCKLVIQKMQEKNIFVGEFIKAVLKINNISNEFEKVAEFIGNVELLHKFKEIQHLTLKYIATNQSLYI